MTEARAQLYTGWLAPGVFALFEDSCRGSMEKKQFLNHRERCAFPAPLRGYPFAKNEERRFEKCHAHTSTLRSHSAVMANPLWRALRTKAEKNCIPNTIGKQNPTPKSKASFTRRSCFRQMPILEARLKETTESIDNLLKAIQMGVITKSTKERAAGRIGSGEK